MSVRKTLLRLNVCCFIVIIGIAADPTSQVPPALLPSIIAPPDLASLHCNGTRADIVFVLDMSSSVGAQNFDLMKSFAKSIVQVLAIGPDKTRVGMITFNRIPFIPIHLDDHTTEKDILAAIDAVQYKSGITGTDSALDLLNREGFRGNNRYVPKIGILITDGEATDKTKTEAAAMAAKNNGITLFTVGIGSQINTQELNKIASSPTQEHVFLVTEFNKLLSIVSTVAEGTCGVKHNTSGTFPPPLQTTASNIYTGNGSNVSASTIYTGNGSNVSGRCNRTVADIMFVLDSSGSLGQYHFTQIKNFVIDIIGALDISRNLTQVGVITFNNYPLLRAPLDRYHNKTELIKAINAIPYTPGNTETNLALDYLRLGGFTGGRDFAPNVAIVITDGDSFEKDKTKIAAAQLKQLGTTMFAIGIGDEIKTDELDAISSDPNSFFRFFVSNFTSLGNILSTVINNTCEVPVRLNTKTTTSTPGTPATPSKPPQTTPTQPPQTTSTQPPQTTSTTAATRRTTTKATVTMVSFPDTTTNAPPIPNTNKMTTSAPVSAVTSNSTILCVNKLADVMFVVDSSGSIGIDNFVKVKNFLKQTINYFDVGTNLTRVGMITFNQQPRLQFGLSKYNTRTGLQSAVDNIVYSQGGTNTGAALELLRNQGFTNDRALAPNIAVVITDGLSADPVATKQQAALLKQRGDTTVIAIGIGNATDPKELSNIASDKGANNSQVYQVGDYDALQTLNSLVAYVACGASPLPANLTRFTPSPTQVSSTPTSDCKDTIQDCSKYSKAMCSDYKPWATAHCSAFCGFCVSSGTPEPRPCVNTIDNCHEYGTYICTSVTLAQWTEDHCAKYCGFCGNGTPPKPGTTSTTTTQKTPNVTWVPGKCTNLISNCDEYGGKGMCQNEAYKAWAKHHCQEYCGYCSNSRIVTSKPLPNVPCPAWKLPNECSLVFYDNTCCPLPQCPPGYTLTAEAPHL